MHQAVLFLGLFLVAPEVAFCQNEADTTQVPDELAILEIEGQHPKPLKVNPLPPYLKGSYVYEWITQPQRFIEYGRLGITVDRDGLVFLAPSRLINNVTRAKNAPKWRDELTSRELLRALGWSYLGACPWDGDRTFYVRQCFRGESFSIRTDQFVPPQAIVAPAVDLLEDRYQKLFRGDLIAELFEDRVHRLFHEGKFEELEAMIQPLRKSHKKFIHGDNMDYVFYSALYTLPPNPQVADAQRIARQLNEWAEKIPNATVPAVALPGFCLVTGLRDDGNRFESRQQQLEYCRAMLENAHDVVSDDLFLAYLQIFLGFANKRNMDEVYQGLEACLRIDPHCYQIFDVVGKALVNTVNFNERSNEELRRYLHFLDERLEEPEASEAYARVVRTNVTFRPQNLFDPWRFSWEKTRRGFTELLKRYPDAWEERQWFCLLACYAGDRETAWQLFTEIGDNPRDAGKIWVSPSTKYHAWKAAHDPQREEGNQERLIWAHLGNVWDVKYSPDGKYLATIAGPGADSHTNVWNANSGELVEKRFLDKEQCTFAADPSYLILNGPTIWNIPTGEVKDFGGHARSASFLALAPNGTFLASSNSDGETIIFDGSTGGIRHRISTAHGGYLKWLAVSPDSKTLATCGKDGFVSLWDPENARFRDRWKAHNKTCNVVAFSKDGRKIATSGSDDTVKVWDAETFAEFASFKWPNESNPYMITFSPNGKLLAMVCYSKSKERDQGVFLWNIGKGNPIQPLVGHAGGAHSADFSPDGKKLATAGFDWSVRIWDVSKVGMSK